MSEVPLYGGACPYQRATLVIACPSLPSPLKCEAWKYKGISLINNRPSPYDYRRALGLGLL